MLEFSGNVFVALSPPLWYCTRNCFTVPYAGSLPKVALVTANA